MADDDARDEALHGLLGVEPLDEVTRRRLVTRALDASDAPGRVDAPADHPREADPPRVASPLRQRPLAALLATAAVFVALALVALAVLSNRDAPEETAARAPTGTPAAEATKGAADRASAEANRSASSTTGDATDATPTPSNSADLSPSVVDLGNVGDLSSTRAQRRLIARIGAQSFGASTAHGLSDKVVAAVESLPCTPGALPAGMVVFTAVGTFHEREAFVVVTEAADGSRIVHLVVTRPCEVRQLG
jgi:hypothetical protein